MASSVKALIDLGLQAQVARLRRVVDDYKERAIAEIKETAISAGITAALAIVALLFLMIALVAGIAAFYLWVAEQYGPFAGLGAVGGAAVALALLSVAVIMLRGGGAKRPDKTDAAATLDLAAAKEADPIAGALRSAVKATEEVTGKAKDTVESVERAGAAARDALDDAVAAIRHGSRPALLATIAGTVMLGVILGRRR